MRRKKSKLKKHMRERIGISKERIKREHKFTKKRVWPIHAEQAW